MRRFLRERTNDPRLCALTQIDRQPVNASCLLPLGARCSLCAIVLALACGKRAVCGCEGLRLVDPDALNSASGRHAQFKSRSSLQYILDALIFYADLQSNLMDPRHHSHISFGAQFAGWFVEEG